MPATMPLLLIPGLLCDEVLWRPQINALKSLADCRVQDTTRHERMDAIARSILAEAPPQFALAGLSMGGYVTFEIMRQAPERVLKLCLLDTSARSDTPEQSERRRLMLAMSKQGQFKGVTPRLLPTLINANHINDKDLVETIMSMAERVGREAFHNQQTAILGRIDSRPFLKNIKCPTQVIGGRQDAVTPPEIVLEIANGISDAKFDLIEDCGHLSTIEQPEKVTELMQRWLAA